MSILRRLSGHIVLFAAPLKHRYRRLHPHQLSRRSHYQARRRFLLKDRLLLCTLHTGPTGLLNHMFLFWFLKCIFLCPLFPQDPHNMILFLLHKACIQSILNHCMIFQVHRTHFARMCNLLSKYLEHFDMNNNYFPHIHLDLNILYLDMCVLHRIPHRSYRRCTHDKLYHLQPHMNLYLRYMLR